MLNWVKLAELVRIDSPWVSLIAERWHAADEEVIDYWRAERADSVIVLPLQNGAIHCAPPMFRPGIGRATLDLPGGRLRVGAEPAEMVPDLLNRELGVLPAAICELVPLNDHKWLVNSSFSNQGLWAFTAEIDAGFPIPPERKGATVKADIAGIDELLDRLDCLQCRAVLLEWRRRLDEAENS